ncbi:MAG: hypothetical protein HWQ41_16010 [Nostoc sp. NOS(2021)]|uniref:hypothetical protein n=1 Tax=Nostoc sp. NOS(2021) TaxID=2815407 RepID=UPI0025FC5BBA|nr:hypothetical protein [Nostoc sp. NOS(2021)]MBN3896710.1 hypothetical protein [Nostoc sp. NOS(2021)]
MSTITISDLNADNFLSDLTANELELIQGGDLGWVKEAWEILNESWTDIKTGIVDGWNGN